MQNRVATSQTGRQSRCQQQRCKRTRRFGFSLIELMVVVVILGMLATVVTVSVRDYLVQGKQTTARNEIAQITSALELYYMEANRYPSNDEGLALLKARNPKHPDGILQGDLFDPWNNPYMYVYPGLHGTYDILSLGGDGQEGGEGADADIVSWDLAGNDS